MLSVTLGHDNKQVTFSYEEVKKRGPGVYLIDDSCKNTNPNYLVHSPNVDILVSSGGIVQLYTCQTMFKYLETNTTITFGNK